MQHQVWIVDDSALDAQRARQVLEPEASIEVFADGSAALERLSSGVRPDVLVLDWVMPGVSGLEVIRFLREQSGPLSKLPVLLLTAQNRPEQVSEGLGAGANDYVAKPYAPEELRARVGALARTDRLLKRVSATEERLRELLGNTPDVIISVDAEGRITFANTEATRVFRCTSDALVGQHLDALVTGLPSSFVDTGRLADVRLHERVYSPSVRAAAGKGSLETLIALRDVTERRQAEERRLDFYSIIAHDLRSPLSVMKLRAMALTGNRRGALPPEAASEVRKIDGSIATMEAIINDFLDVAKLQSSDQGLDRHELPMGPLIESTVDELRPLAEAGSLDLLYRPDDCECRVLGDSSRLRQVLANLVGNAIKFTPPRGLVEVRLAQRAGVVETQVHDTGPGIAPDALPRLFDRYTRAGTKSTTAGWGLGLMIVREIVEAHGGAVGVDSQKGAGSTFWFRLPSATSHAPA